MDQYITGAMIRRLREDRKLTQAELAAKLSVSDKAVSRWETGKGYPDVSLLETLADSLGVSLIELMSGSSVTNTNRSFNMNKLRFYVCPVCGNVILSTGEAVISCCGIVLPPLEADAPDPRHTLNVEKVEDEYYLSAEHPMEKTHYLSFLAAVRDDGAELVKLYPEGSAEARVGLRRVRRLYWYCSRDGLFTMPVNPRQFR